jgi:CHAT domain-containing protein
MGEYAKAEPLLQQALRINQKNFGGEHPKTVLYLDNLGYVKFQLGRIEEAKDLAHLKAQAELALVSKVFSFTTEQQRLAYLNEFDPYDLFVLLNGSQIDLAAAVLRYKGAVLDSVIEDRLVAEASRDLDDRKLIEQLQSARQQLGKLLLQTAHEESSETNRRIEELEKQAEGTEAKLTQKVSHLGQARRSLHVTIEQVQSALPQNAALVEYLHYWHYLTIRKREPHFAAIVLYPKRPPVFVPLGKAQEIETLVRRYQKLVRRHSEDEELSANLSALYTAVWEPIQHALPEETKRLIISPDGQLNFLGFSTLLTPDKRFMAEKFIVQYAASGRDLMRDSKPAQNNGVIVFGNPDFQLNASKMLARAGNQTSQNGPGMLRGAETRDMEDLSFPALDGTQAECEHLAAKFKGWNWKTTGLTGAAASKQALLNAHSPYVLHLATHGFFEQKRETESKIEPQLATFAPTFTLSRFFINPMHRSGLALAGAETTLAAWKQGDVPPIETDGIVTAEDISTIDLKGTWLVTLSACDTGSGEARAGEGVLGLRRGFIEAGAQNLLMTLWPISDEFTVQIMSDFYEAAHRGGDAPLALATVQRDWLVRLRKEKGLAQAVNLAGPFIMNSQGKP